MKQRIISLFTAVSCLGFAPLAFGQAYPSKPIRIVAPFAPGGGAGLTRRTADQRLAKQLGQQAGVDSGPGAGGVLGAELGAKAPPDGYTFTLIAGSYAVNPSLFKLNFDPVNDITPG